MNYSDSERIETYLNNLGFKKTEKKSQADVIIFNTCSVRKKAEDRVLGQMGTMRKLRKKNPKLIVVITGCMTRISSSRNSTKKDPVFVHSGEIDIVLKTSELHKLASLIRELQPKIKIPKIKEETVKNYFKINATHSTHKSKAQAFIPISNGCDKFCSYCIVPYARGPEKSRSLKEILAEAENVVKNGCKEIWLIGQTVNSYGKSKFDKKNKTFTKIKGDPFVYLLKEIDKLKNKGLERVRFTSSHPIDMSKSLISAMASLKTQMPYLHLPAQSGDDRTLKRMCRPYTTKKYAQIISDLRKKIPNISISTDIIVGFCSETENEFKKTCDFFKKMKFEHAYHAQYSTRKGTTASRFMKDDVSVSIKKKRWEEFNKILKKQSADALKKYIGHTVNVLVDDQKGTKCLGRSENYKIVEFNSMRNLLGEIVPVKITNSREWNLEGELF